ncbi:class I SAM-dependent methyltransferase [Candidatus Blastococcus massiliensis]|uniref:class I SAM-dependent methyltransferase n=1 Tax=Candidatus Blastococcus massiliensis TaxID=1470358 RepID=UPI0004B8F0F0|nr:class I SAM-dependent methyltransferase [Candidatus Blastococcus massiliensis]
MTATAPAPVTAPRTLAETAPQVLALVAGYVGHRTVSLGLRSGLLRALADRPGSTADDLADALSLDPFYVSVWCRAAFGAGVLERADGGYRLGDHMATLLLATGSPAFVGGVFGVCEAGEVFDRFEASLSSGERMWWEDTSPEWIAAVAGTGTPFYTRLVPGGLERVPGLAERLTAGCTVVDTACGAGVGAIRLATTYPRCTVVGVDGDAHSIDRARERIAAAGLAGRITLVHSALEDMALGEQATLVINNISMHECRDIDRVAANVMAALEPGGWFVVSDFPFPDTDEGLRSTPGRVMSGIQFFEAQIDDQLLPRSAYDDLLTRHGFTDLGSAQLTPMHALTWGRRP